MKKNEVQQTANANLKMNKQLEDMNRNHNIKSTVDETNDANLKLNEEFNSDDRDVGFPAYIYNNTPAIRIQKTKR
jgi:hypothetical protein